MKKLIFTQKSFLTFCLSFFTLIGFSQTCPSYKGHTNTMWDLVAANKNTNVYLTTNKEGQDYWWTYLKLENKTDVSISFVVEISYEVFKKVGNIVKREIQFHQLTYSLTPQEIRLYNLPYLSLYKPIIKEAKVKSPN